jgi:Mg2+ and Co2+ transporter CorA
MSRRPYIRGISGILHLGILEKRRGSIDVLQNQLCMNDEQILTPNVVRMHGCLDVYMNKMYSFAVERMKGVYEELSGLFTEQERIKSQAVIEVMATGEEGQRQLAALQAKKEEDMKRLDEIKQRTAFIKESLASANEMVKHHMERAEDILRSHLSVYWSGVIRKSQEQLPVYPVIKKTDCKGIREYENHICQIGAMVDTILAA